MAEAVRSFGKYEILDQLGRGGFATVYRARDTTLEREVALKILHPHYALEPDFAQRFLQEARTVASLSHPQIITLFEVGDLDGQLFIAMELVDGGTLHQYLEEKGSLSVAETATLLNGIADALDYAHGQGLVHRDIKPANILLKTSHRGRIIPILTDFGLVKALSRSTQLTRSGSILGTLEYMAPEQIDADLAEQIGPATDIYALGIVAYHMLAGQVPFSGSTANVMNGHLNKTAPPIAEMRDEVPQQVSDVILRALAKDPGKRWPSASAFVSALAATGEAVTAPPPGIETKPDESAPPGRPPESTPVIEPAAAPATPASEETSTNGRNRRLLYIAGGAVLGIIALFIGLNLMTGPIEETFNDVAATTTAEAEANLLLTPPVLPEGGGKGEIGGQDPLDPSQTDAGQSPLEIATLSPELALPTFTPTPDLTATVEYKAAVTRDELSGYLVFTRNEGDGESNANEIMRYDLDSGELIALTANAYDDHIPRWSPDGSQIAFTSNRAGNYDIWLMDAGGGHARPLIATGGWDDYAAWAPAWMAGVNGPLAFVTTADNSSEVHLFENGEITRLTDHPGRDEWPSWWIEGEALVFGSERAGSMDLYVLPLSAGAQQYQQVYGSAGEAEAFISSDADENEPAWSPQGHEIAFVSRQHADDAYGQIVVVDSSGENERSYGEFDAANPAWSPDGEWLVYGRGVDSDGDGTLSDRDDSDIWALRLSDGLQMPLIEGEGRDGSPDWTAQLGSFDAASAGLRAWITGIRLEGGRYIVDFETFGYTAALPGRHVHFFWNTVPPEDAGAPGSGPWQIYPTQNGQVGDSPFTLFGPSDRPQAANQLCILVANGNHSVQSNSGNCYPLP